MVCSGFGMDRSRGNYDVMLDLGSSNRLKEYLTIFAPAI